MCLMFLRIKKTILMSRKKKSLVKMSMMTKKYNNENNVKENKREGNEVEKNKFNKPNRFKS